jgi:hypothetical protein
VGPVQFVLGLLGSSGQLHWSRRGGPFSTLPTTPQLLSLLPAATLRSGLQVYLMLSDGQFVRVRPEEGIERDRLASIKLPAVTCFFLRVAFDSPASIPMPRVEEVAAAVRSAQLSSGELKSLLKRVRRVVDPPPAPYGAYPSCFNFVPSGFVRRPDFSMQLTCA